MFIVSADEKALIDEAVAKAFAYDMQPLIFWHGKKDMA